MEKKNNIALPDLETMALNGVHIGALRSHGNAKMKPYIWGRKNSFEIIDLEKSRDALKAALEFLISVREKGGVILFVGTGVAVKEIIRKIAEELEAPYVAERWLGGTMTNFSTIKKSVERLKELEEQKAKGEFEKYTKYEALKLDEKIKKLRKEFGGIVNLNRLPDAIWISSANYDKIAVAEAIVKNISIIGIVNTNSDPTKFTYPIPANDTALSSVSFILNLVRETLTSVKPVVAEQPESKLEKKDNGKN